MLKQNSRVGKLLLSACLLILFQVSFVVVSFQSSKLIGLNKAMATATVTATVSLSVSVLEYLSFSITSGSEVDMGSVAALTVGCASTATVSSVSTNSANGYVIMLSDNITGSDSPLINSTGTRIRDMSYCYGDWFPVMLPAAMQFGDLWGDNAWGYFGLGVTNFEADTNKDSRWGTGTAVCDTNNGYTGITQTPRVGHSVTGFRSGPDTSSWGWALRVRVDQPAGTYTGTPYLPRLRC